ncbi:MBL fold metallo-hydrolase [Desulfatitalea alkaliphila]|uniref:MBL fold metallo-hydrolase n=1 Tax=Desulfatitalea alkaliphila TaxID=2929485 RepID=A0AA41R799_9BACT|nr:MBL fold metallo-hydrolase [Desulfatitalea alkaliphila]MCJ8502241.1 MBL fold metallo-hydrolase [Desulfatitalea alkaliphila]
MELASGLHAFIWDTPNVNNCNSYLLRSAEKTILVDPGHAAYFDHVRRGLERIDLTPENIDLVICTHAHPDHMEAARLLTGRASPPLLALHAAEWALVQSMAPYLKATMGVALEDFEPDFFLDEGPLQVGDLALIVHHTPGHSPGGVTLYWPEHKALIVGDLVFNGGLGRTDLPGGDGNQLKQSIRRMSEMDAEWLLSGHGQVLSGAAAIKTNFQQVEQTWFNYI